ncbi:MAG TPA: class I SAM-dependent methyltransferase [Phycisphaerales bacterium]|nr:class I SAM-dependent methyltransferase [Phycisphaerales bacterium]HRQ75197.1 class I SAM-dependent methyltransferase [Phycisphaerales bacterium]
MVHAAIELTRARQRSTVKFPHRADLIADIAGLEQATSDRVAEHKAKRFAKAMPSRIVDLCCGIGGDAMRLQTICPVIAIDRDPLRAWMAAQNARCKTIATDVESLDLHELRETTGTLFHIDPSRRDEDAGSKRAWKLHEYRPGPAFLRRLLAISPDGAIKLGPGVDFDTLIDLAPTHTAEVEVINENGALVQAILWCGKLAECPGERTATRLDATGAVRYSGVPSPIPQSASAAFTGYLLVPDPAIERAGLVGTLAIELGIQSPFPPLGLLCADAPPDSPWFAAFEVLDEMPWRIPTIRAWLKANDGGIVEVKTRGGAVETDKAQLELRGSGNTIYAVFGLRMGRSRKAVITRRIARVASDS